MTLRQIGQLVLMSALWDAMFMLINAQQYKIVSFRCGCNLKPEHPIDGIPLLSIKAV
jgi:hypothetical protein